MPAPTDVPPVAPWRDHVRVGAFLWRRRLPLVALVLAATFAAGSIVFAELQSNVRPGRPTFIARISPRGVDGRFVAVAAIRGERPGTASCTVEAFDLYGQTVGTRQIDLGRVEPGEVLEWRGRLRVESRVERMRIDCR
jgi:hypothetical protein